MKALLMNAFRYFFRRTNRPTKGSDVHQSETREGQHLDFSRLKEVEQEAIKQYFAAMSNLLQTFKFIKEYGRAVDLELVLEAFERAERSYHWYNMRPIFPPSLRLVSEFDTARLIELGLMVRSSESEKVVMYAPAMRAFATRLKTKTQPRELDSRAPLTPA